MAWLKGIACLSLAAVTAAPVAAQRRLPEPAGKPAPRVVLAAERIEELRAALAAAETELVVRRKVAEARALLPTDVVRQEARVEELAAALAEAEGKVAKARALEALQQPVDLSLRDATLPEAVDALAEAADLEIALDEDEAKLAGPRITLTARGIPAYAALVTLAGQAGRMIAPDPDSDGVALRRWPELAVNGARRTFTSRFAPWSEEWGDTVAPFAPPTGSPYSGPPAREEQESRATPIPSPAAPLPQSPIGAPTSVGHLQAPSVTLSVAGERLVVVSEAGTGSKGETGAWLTVYQLDASARQLRRVSRTFHPAASSAPLAPGRATAPPKARTSRR